MANRKTSVEKTASETVGGDDDDDPMADVEEINVEGVTVEKIGTVA